MNRLLTAYLAPLVLCVFLPKVAYSEANFHLQSKSSPHYLLAQNTPATNQNTQNIDEESFDPFSDYSEFDESSDEEADINFFRNGRFLTVKK